MKVGKLAFILECTKDHFAPFSLKCLTRYYMIISFVISSFMDIHLLIHSTDKTPVVDKRDITISLSSNFDLDDLGSRGTAVTL